MIACFLSNIFTKYYKNLSMLSRVIAKNVGDVFMLFTIVLSTNVRSTSSLASFCLHLKSKTHLFAVSFLR